jgi:hypothetical protein
VGVSKRALPRGGRDANDDFRCNPVTRDFNPTISLDRAHCLPLLNFRFTYSLLQPDFSIQHQIELESLQGRSPDDFSTLSAGAVPWLIARLLV